MRSSRLGTDISTDSRRERKIFVGTYTEISDFNETYSDINWSSGAMVTDADGLNIEIRMRTDSDSRTSTVNETT